MMDTQQSAVLKPQQAEAMRAMEEWLSKLDRLLGGGKPGAKQARDMVRSSLFTIRQQLRNTTAPDRSEAVVTPAV